MALDEATILALAREECGQPPTTEVSDDLMGAFYLMACTEVNIAINATTALVGTFSTVANKKEYDLPEGCIRVLRLYWGPVRALVSSIGAPREDYDFDAVEVGESLRAARRDRIDRFSYQWEVMNFGDGKKIVLGVTPTIGGVEILYKYVAFSQSDADIPDALADAVRERVKCEVFKTRHAYWTTHEEITQAADFSELASAEYRRAAQECEKRFKQLLHERI